MLQNKESRKNGDSSADTMFTVEETRPSYIEFQRQDPSSLRKVCVVSVAGLDAVMSDAVDISGPATGRLSNEGGKNIDLVSKLGTASRFDQIKVTEQKINKSETILQESVVVLTGSHLCFS